MVEKQVHAQCYKQKSSQLVISNFSFFVTSLDPMIACGPTRQSFSIQFVCHSLQLTMRYTQHTHTHANELTQHTHTKHPHIRCISIRTYVVRCRWCALKPSIRNNFSIIPHINYYYKMCRTSSGSAANIKSTRNRSFVHFEFYSTTERTFSVWRQAHGSLSISGSIYLLLYIKQKTIQIVVRSGLN